MGAGGVSETIEVPDDQYILDTAIDAGLEIPFSCRGGVCGACVGKVTSGQVDMSDIDDLEFTVTEEEQEDGMALLCMARPVVRSPSPMQKFNITRPPIRIYHPPLAIRST
jgi:2Fe-2S type ferredoxin